MSKDKKEPVVAKQAIASGATSGRGGRFSAPRKAQAVLRLLRGEALEPLRQGIREYYGAFVENIADGLMVRHDHGSQYMADDFQDELVFLGITASPFFVREPQGNGCAERCIRTLKENLLWVRTFETVEELRQAVLKFKKDYDEQWMIQRLGHQTPAQARECACRPPKKVA